MLYLHIRSKKETIELNGFDDYEWKKTMSGKEVMKLLVKNGWELVNSEGSHFKYTKNGKIVIVPRHRELKSGTFKGIKETVKQIENL